MGRDKPKKFSKMGYFEKEEYKDEMAKKLGIQGTKYRDSRGNTQYRRNDKALNDAIKNNFDYRTSAQHMDGVKGNASMKDFNKYERGAVKLHKQAGNGGQYSSNKDITGVTNNLVRDSQREFRDDIMSDIDGKYATAAKLNALQDKIKERAEQSGPVEISSTLTNAQRGVGAYDEDKISQGANIFGAIAPANDLELAREEVQANEASGDGLDYTDKYKLNVKGGLQLSGITTRGPGSGINGEGF